MNMNHGMDALSQSLSTITLASKVVCSFDKVADDYDKGRPDYPPGAMQIFAHNLNLQSDTSVLDLACGTGKLTKALVKEGYCNITAVDPAEEMTRHCASLFPQIQVSRGSAESMPLLASSHEVVVVGTAFHWFDGYKALNEIARVLVPNGRLGLIWNMFNPEYDWVKQIRSLLDQYAKNESHDTTNWQEPLENDKRFSALGHYTYRYTYKGTPEEVIDRLLSSKTIGSMTALEKEALTAQARYLLRTHHQTANKAVLEIPYRVEMYWCSKVKEATRSWIDLTRQVPKETGKISIKRSWHAEDSYSPPKALC